MKEEKLLENIGQVKEKFVEEAAPKGLLAGQEEHNISKKAVIYRFVKWGSLAACLCIIAGLGIKFTQPMFEPMEQMKMDNKDTMSYVEEDALTSDNLKADTKVYTNADTSASTEALPNKPESRPEEDFDGNIGTDFTTDQGFPNWGLNLSVENVTSTGLTLVVTQSGGEPTGELQTGEAYRLITLVDGTWKTVEELPLPEGVDGRAWNSIAYLLPKEETREFEINWNWIFGELPSGTYRLIKEFMDFRKTADYDTAEYWVEFEIQ